MATTTKPARMTVQVNYATDPSLAEEIDTYMHCAKCLEEWNESFRGILSPRDYARMHIGIRKDGNFQVVCARHNCNVAVITMTVAATWQEPN